MKTLLTLSLLTISTVSSAAELEWTCTKKMTANGKPAGTLSVHAFGVPKRGSLKTRLKTFFRDESGVSAQEDEFGTSDHDLGGVDSYQGVSTSLVVWLMDHPLSVGELKLRDGTLIDLMAEKLARKDLFVTELQVNDMTCSRPSN